MRSDKRGQFYLLAAVVIIVIIIGFASVNNFLKKGSGVDLGYTGEELDFESGQVLEYGVSSEDNAEELIEHFTTSYEGYAGEDKEILFVIGNKGGFEAYTYSDVITGTIDIIGTSTRISRKKKKTGFNVKIVGDDVSVTFNEQVYVFEIKPGENFYFVISQTIGEEEYIVTN